MNQSNTNRFVANNKKYEPTQFRFPVSFSLGPCLRTFLYRSVRIIIPSTLTPMWICTQTFPARKRRMFQIIKDSIVEISSFSLKTPLFQANIFWDQFLSENFPLFLCVFALKYFWQQHAIGLVNTTFGVQLSRLYILFSLVIPPEFSDNDF